ncbi:MAG: YigZ family protein [Oscillospiraceae bacterium]|nr:YigZ family protein [Oscillospiraceae bacterium]
MQELIVKKSRFISYAKQVDSEESAKAYIAEITRGHKKARHITFAYLIAQYPAEGGLPAVTHCRHSDDGEPHGTAGLPLMNSIQRRNMENVVVVVVRYFGGILLGKGGLIRAYGKAAGLALEALSEELDKC